MTSMLPSDFVPIDVEDVETIHGRMLEVIQEVDPDTDVQLGSPAWDATRPGAQELQDIQQRIVDGVLATIPATSWGIYLDELVKEADIERKGGGAAAGVVTFEAFSLLDVPEGTVLLTEAGLRYLTTEAVTVSPPTEQEDPDNPQPGLVTVAIVAEAEGAEYNVPPFSIRFIDRAFEGLVTVIQDTAVAGGYDAETDEELKQRYFLRIRNTSGGGNRKDYENWALEVEQVSAVKVFAADPSPGSVTVLVWTKEGTPSVELLDEVRDKLNERASLIANNVVLAPSTLAINISGTLTVMQGYDEATISTLFEAAVSDYLNGVTFSGSPVRYTELLKRLLDIEGVIDVTGFALNGTTGNVVLGEKQAPVLGTVTL